MEENENEVFNSESIICPIRTRKMIRKSEEKTEIISFNILSSLFSFTTSLPLLVNEQNSKSRTYCKIKFFHQQQTFLLSQLWLKFSDFFLLSSLGFLRLLQNHVSNDAFKEKAKSSKNMSLWVYVRVDATSLKLFFINFRDSLGKVIKNQEETKPH